MEFLKTISKRKTLLSEIIYVALNIGLAITLLLVTRLTGSLVPPLIIVLLSKWRVLAVRTRYWAANIQANLICFIVSVSYVIFLFSTNPDSSDLGNTESWIVQCVLALLYIGWLTWLKPKTKRVYIVAQAGAALFTGITAVFVISYGWIATPVVLLTWLIGYSTARHVITSYEEDHVMLFSLSFGLVMAEIGWLAYHWTIAYRLPFVTNVMVPQVSIISLLIAFITYQVYNSIYHHQKIKMNDIIAPLIFSFGLIGLLLLFRNGIDQIIF